MKTTKWLLALILASVMAAGSAWADPGHHGHHDHVGIGFYWGPGWGWPWYYPPPYYYPPAVVTVPSAPPVYVEQSAPVQVPQAYAPPAPDNSWYYCASSRSYYPYVRDCPDGWQRVAPQPPKPQ
jgi:hypothetical protein